MLETLQSSVPSLIIVFREMIEAGLIIGIVLSATRGVVHRSQWVLGGIGAGIVGALVVAFFAEVISNSLEGIGQDVFNAGILFFAVGMLAWHNIWMASHGKEIAGQMKSVGHQVQTGRKSLFALATVIGIAVLREGAEVVLFLYGMMASGKYTAASLSLGLGLGVFLGGLLSAFMYFGLVFVPLKRLFAVTGVMITLLAAGMASQGALFLAQSGLITSFGHTLWDTSWILSDESMIARILSVLIGYTAQPTGLQVLFYSVTLLVIMGAMRLFGGGAGSSVKRGTLSSSAVLAKK
jgi:high-affinity iron transporter